MKLVNGTRQPVNTYPKIQKICSQIYHQIQALYNPEGLTKNTTRGRESLASLVLMYRKLSDAMNLDVFFHSYARNGQVYIITNNPAHCGLDIPLKEFQATILGQIRKARTSRTSHDGLRLALTLLDSKYRESVSLIMTNRKDRCHSDITGDFVLHFFEQVMKDSFSNPEYKPPQPQRDLFGNIDDDEILQWDPNDPKIFEIDRSAAWLQETWKIYVKRKYKSALDHWNKETGGGNGQSWSFINYCDKDARWLVVVFLLDVQANYLLASNAGGRMPAHLQMECGFGSSPTESSSSDENNSDHSAATKARLTSKKRTLLDAAQDTKKLKEELGGVMQVLSSITQRTSTTTSASVPIGTNAFDEIAKLNQMLKDNESIVTMSPNSREMYLEGLHAERKYYIKGIGRAHV